MEKRKAQGAPPTRPRKKTEVGAACRPTRRVLLGAAQRCAQSPFFFTDQTGGLRPPHLRPCLPCWRPPPQAWRVLWQGDAMDVGTDTGLFANAAVSTAVTFFSTAELRAFLGCFFGSSHLLIAGLVVCATQADAAMGAATTSAAIHDANGGGSVSRTTIFPAKRRDVAPHRRDVVPKGCAPFDSIGCPRW